MYGFWIAGGSLLTSRKGHVSAGGRTSAISTGGIGSDLSVLSSTEIYTSGTWASSGALLTPRAYATGGGSPSSAMVFGGESSSGKLNTSEVFNGSTWSTGPTMISHRSYFGGDFNGSSAFAIGGSGSSGILSSTEILSGGVWSSAGNLVTPRVMHSAGGTGSSAICMGGFYEGEVLAGVEVYNGSSWSSTESMLTARMSGFGGGVSSDVITGAGSDLSGNYYNSVEVFDGSTWRSAGSLLLSRADLSGDGNHGDGIISGGAREYGCYSSSEEFYPLVPYTSDVLLTKALTRQYSAKSFFSYVDKDRFFYKCNISRLIKYETVVGAGLKVLSDPTKRPVLSTIFKAWVEQLDNVHKRCRTVGLSHKLDYATGDDIDTKWGKLYDLPRFLNEDDDRYRKRIKTYVLSQIGSGTKNVCEDVLDEIVGYPGSTEISVYEPGRVFIRWNNPYAASAAFSDLDLLEYSLNRSLAAGIDWVIYRDFISYNLDIRTNATIDLSWINDLLLSHTFELSYTSSAFMKASHDTTIDADIVLLATKTRTCLYRIRLLKGLMQSYLGSMILKRISSKSNDMDILMMRRNLTVARNFDIVSLKRNINKSYVLDELITKSMIRPMWYSLSIMPYPPFKVGMRVV
ncbi:MAG: hypothetical protein GYA36_23315 [Veillonellaceae bacterium]|nr:hypothetical protein [Veillonellaceae bacterium]